MFHAPGVTHIHPYIPVCTQQSVVDVACVKRHFFLYDIILLYDENFKEKKKFTCCRSWGKWAGVKPKPGRGM